MVCPSCSMKQYLILSAPPGCFFGSITWTPRTSKNSLTRLNNASKWLILCTRSHIDVTVWYRSLETRSLRIHGGHDTKLGRIGGITGSNKSSSLRIFSQSNSQIDSRPRQTPHQANGGSTQSWSTQSSAQPELIAHHLHSIICPFIVEMANHRLSPIPKDILPHNGSSCQCLISLCSRRVSLHVNSYQPSPLRLD